MIPSAQVFSPRPSQDPRENLRTLQSPLKNSFKPPTPRKAYPSSPIHRGASAPDSYSDESDEEDEDEDEDDIILVEGNHPRVVQEDKDLVILEDVEVEEEELLARPALPPRTPQRPRSQSLHRAVLLRSIQKAVWKAEKEREEEIEEMEVLGSVVDRDQGLQEDEGEEDEEEEEEEEEVEEVEEVEDEQWREEKQYGDQDHAMDEGESPMDEDAKHEQVITDDEDTAEPPEPPGDESEGHGVADDSESDSEDEAPRRPTTHAQKSMWRKSIERLWPFSKSSSPMPADDKEQPKDQEQQEQEEEALQSHKSDGGNDIDQALPEVAAPAAEPPRTPSRKKISSSYYTPQPGRPLTFDSSSNIFQMTPGGRASTAGAPGRIVATGPGPHRIADFMPQRIKQEEPWRVNDLLLPQAAADMENPLIVKREAIPPVRPKVEDFETPTRGRQRLTEEEKRVNLSFRSLLCY